MVERKKQLPLKHAETAAAFVLTVQAAAGAVGLLLGWVSGSPAAMAEGWHLLVGVAFWLACVVHQRLRRVADEEALETEAITKAAGQGSSLFEQQEVDLLSARRRLEQFEKLFLPIFSVVTCAILGVLSYFLLHRLVTTPEPGAIRSPLMASVVFIGIAFASFLLAKYTAGLAVEAPWRAVRSGANYTMSNALASLLVGVALIAYHFDLPVVERVVAYAIPVLLGLLTVEIFLSLVMNVYRPRVAGQEWRPAHDSRMLGMLATSSGILRTTAETLDYQFGFKVSETWFFRFMERAIAPLILFQLLTLYALTCFLIVDTGEQAVIEFLGKPRNGTTVLGPGIHLKWPWPIEIAYRYPARRVEMLAIGEQLEENVPGYTWTKGHATVPFSVLSANRPRPAAGSADAAGPAAAPKKEGAGGRTVPPVSMLAGTVNVYYTVSNLYKYLYSHSAPKDALEAICYNQLVRYSAQTDFLDFLGHQRGEAVEALKEWIQAAADRDGLGVDILAVTLQGLHPPVEVGANFEAVVGAREQREAEVWRARGYENQTVPDARAQAAALVAEATSYKVRQENVAPAKAARFLEEFKAYLKAPDVYLYRKRMSALEEAMADQRKLIMPDWMKVGEVLNINLEEKIVPGSGIGETELMTTEEGTAP